MIDWSGTAIWWQVYPLGFVGAEPSRLPAGRLEHRLPDVSWLDHLISLGCNGLLLGPIFESESHGYDTVDHLAIDRRLGDDHDFDRLVAAAHDRGIRVLLDGVFNHLGRAHPRVRAAVQDGPDSEAGRWLRWTERDGQPVPDNFEGHDRLVALNHDHPPVAELVTGVLDRWLQRGVDGWRLDAAYQVPAAFWAGVLPVIRERHPQAWFVGEMIHGDYAGYAAASGLDSITQYELWKAIWSSINDHNFFELSWALQRHADFVAAFQPLTFIGNHDVTRIASMITDERHLPHAVALLFFLPGVPSVYYGDGDGLPGVKEDRLGGDDAIRPAFPPTPDQLTPAVDGLPDLYRQLIAVRRRHRYLADATVDVELLEDERLVLAASGRAADESVLRLILNLSDEPLSTDSSAGDAVLAASAPGRPPGDVEPHGWCILAAE
ncbi:alpha-amylase family glycosyl hydrolase [Microlunatus soli]|uniref:Alpha-amylase n=1 Tax=Microlunatus soli TaxID=630515 RepID=A0A1H1RCG1_9ACTN|nr:alpha-amylase family glycosyl hydrolase [Microlunatus soli]SDS33411.1 Glycosidase [Microlunatus soli]